MTAGTTWLWICICLVAITASGCGQRSLDGHYKGANQNLVIDLVFQESNTLKWAVSETAHDQSLAPKLATYAVQGKAIVSDGRVIGEIIDSETIDFYPRGIHFLLKRK